MPRPSDPVGDRAAPEAAPPDEVIALLALLCRPGSRLRTRGASSTVIDVGKGGGVRERRVAGSAAERARSAGFVAAAPDECGDEVISVRGRAAYRQSLMTKPARHGDRRSASFDRAPMRERQRRAAAAAAAAVRPHERRSVVEQLAMRKDVRGKPLLDHIQLAAGLRLARDFAIAQLQPRVTARWSAEPVNKPRRRSAPGAGVEISEAASAARERVRRALADLGGDLAGMALDVCCFDHALQAVAAARHWSTVSARLALALALGRLAQHYGMVAPTIPAGRIRQWAEADFKPNVDTWISKPDA